ncbi:MAG: hypothetical protein H6525_03200 [Actinobacteria bacterium]|nr:hypothetical protein [Actinomycetota bacterium]MCB9411842.1 hypothetical protein [Actinomycetota bacterium]
MEGDGPDSDGEAVEPSAESADLARRRARRRLDSTADDTSHDPRPDADYYADVPPHHG